MILGLPGDPATPAPSTIGKGGLAFVNVVSRWQLRFTEIQGDPTKDLFGEPLMYEMMQADGRPIRIHPSRVIPFRADTTASLADMTMIGSTADVFWGESTVAQVLDAVKDSDTARASFAALLHKARLLRIGIPNLSSTVGTADGESLIMARLAILAAAESIHNATIFEVGTGENNPGEKIEDVSYNFAGAKDVLNTYAEFVAAISDIPTTRLLGRAPEGLNASGESQQKDWQKKVRALQTLDLQPCMDRLDNYLVMSALGSRPDEIWAEWAPLDTPDQKQVAERFKIEAEAIEKVANLAAMPDRALNRGVQSWLIENGYLPELEIALTEIPEDERWGIEREGIEGEQEGGDPASGGVGGPEVDPGSPRRAANDAAPRSLYVQRKLLNAAEFIAWAKGQGFDTTTPADELHVTVLYSRALVDWMKMGTDWHGDQKGVLTVPAGGARLVEPLGDKGAVVLLFSSSALSWRHEEMVRNGASHDYDEYQPHVTITYAKPEGLDLSTVEPFRGPLRFGPEIFEELDEGWRPSEA